MPRKSASNVVNTTKMAIFTSLSLIKKSIQHIIHIYIQLMPPCMVEKEGVNRTFIMVALKVLVAVNFMSVMSQSRVIVVLAFIAAAACVAAASKLTAFIFISLVVFCTRKRVPSSGVHR
jgi:hypothetical protein